MDRIQHNLIYDDKFDKQKIYLTIINLSSNINVVIEMTMIQSHEIVQECGKSYMQVAYDLIITKSLQIQYTEKSRFNNLFIHTGLFHIMMAFYTIEQKREWFQCIRQIKSSISFYTHVSI